MKKISLCLGLLLALVMSASAQVTVEVVLDQQQYLPSEDLVVAVRITNRSGQTLKLGNDNDWLSFSVEGKGGYLVGKEDEVPVTGEFELGSSKVATKRVNIAPYFNIGKPGRYGVEATVKLKQWDTQITSKDVKFDIIHGTKMWERDFGVPAAGGSKEAPEVRKYILQQAHYMKQMKLYVRLTDAAETKVYKVFPVGPMVSFSQPEPQVDSQSNLHLLYQIGAGTFSYNVINPQGEVTVRQTYEYTSTRPKLKSNETGISVSGGVRRNAASDIPQVRAEASTDDKKTQQP